MISFLTLVEHVSLLEGGLSISTRFSRCLSQEFTHFTVLLNCLVTTLNMLTLNNIIGWGFCDIQNNQGWSKAEGWGWNPLPRPWLLWISQKANLPVIIILFYSTLFLFLHWREATQSAQTWHGNLWPWVSLTW